MFLFYMTVISHSRVITSRPKTDGTEREAKVSHRPRVHARALYSRAFHEATRLGRGGDEGANGAETVPGRRLRQFLECVWVGGGHDYRDFLDAFVEQLRC